MNRPWDQERLLEFVEDQARFLAFKWWAEQVRNINTRFYIWTKPGLADANGTPWVPLVSPTCPSDQGGWKQHAPCLNSEQGVSYNIAQIRHILCRVWALPMPTGK